MLRFDHVGVIVEDLDRVEAFFAALGFETGERMRLADSEVVDRIIGIDGSVSEISMVKAAGANLELIRYAAPVDDQQPRADPPNRLGYRHIALEIDDVHATVGRLAEQGYGLVGEVQDYGTSYRLCYVRGPEGLIVELAQDIQSTS